MSKTPDEAKSVPIPEYVLDAIPHLKEGEAKVLLAIARKLIESNQPEARITVTELEDVTKMARDAVSTAAIALDSKGLLVRRLAGKGYRSGMLYSLSSGATLQLRSCKKYRDRVA